MLTTVTELSYMLKSLTTITSCLIVSGCSVVSTSATWERVVNAPRTITGTGTRSAAYAEGLHAELQRGNIAHKVVTYNYPFYSKFDGKGTAQRTSVIYSDAESQDNPWWLMDERLMRPVRLPTLPVDRQVSFFLRRPVTVVTLREYAGGSGKAVAPIEEASKKAAITHIETAPPLQVSPVTPPKKPAIPRIERSEKVEPTGPWLLERWFQKIRVYLTPKKVETTPPMPAVGEGPAKRPLFRPAGVPLRPFFRSDVASD